MRSRDGDTMDEHLYWSAGRKSCWGVTARVLVGFGAVVTVAWLSGAIGTGHAEIAAAVSVR